MFRANKQWRTEARKREVDREMLDDLGVNIIEDSSSRDSASSRHTNTPTLLL
jgi:hypothetical protein